MQWILLAVVAIALLALSTRYPKTAFGILGALTLAAVVIVFTTHDEAALGRQKLPVADVDISNAVMTPAYGGSHQLYARLANKNPSRTLREVTISITMLDCPGDVAGQVDDQLSHMASSPSAASCVVIGQAAERFNVQIPPRQSRDISRNLFFRAAATGTLRWQYRITATRS